jgi:hypothetical protein
MSAATGDGGEHVTVEHGAGVRSAARIGMEQRDHDGHDMGGQQAEDETTQ